MTTLKDFDLSSNVRLQQFPDTPNHLVRPFSNYLKAIPTEVENTRCTKVFLLVSKSLDSKTDRIKSIEAALGDKVVGKKTGIATHTPYTDIIDLTKQLWETGADSIVVIGSSSYTDAAKVAMIVHANFKPSDELSVSRVESLAADSETKHLESLEAPTLSLFLTPTSLSAAEYNAGAGARNPDTHQKHLFTHPNCAAKCVILDPELCTVTPIRLWLVTGMRAIDHCVETLCTDKCTRAAASVVQEGLRHLMIGLLASHADPTSVPARGQCQLGAWQAMRGIHDKIPMGASHAIGHHLGGVANVSHGETSCVMLPAVLKYNQLVNAELQKRATNILWDIGGPMFKRAGLTPDADTGDILKVFIKSLDLPTSLREVGVGEDRYDMIATYTLSDLWAKTNPRPLTNVEQVKEILRMSA